MTGLLLTLGLVSLLFWAAWLRRRLVRELRAEVERRRRLEGEMKRQALQLLEAHKRQALQLLQAHRRFLEISLVGDDLVAKVSHELRTPLASLKEGLSLMLDGALGPTNETQVDFLKTMDGDIDRLTGLINNMLDLSKLEADRMRLNRFRMALPELIQKSLKSYQAISSGYTVTQRIEPVPDVFVDCNRMLQVLGNLFSNALKHARPGGQIQFIVEPQDGLVAVRVRDDGEGIAPQDLCQLFQKFSQVCRPEGRVRGTGLGLVICKEIVELHDGRIEVESRLGQGSTFSVLLHPYSDTLALRESFQEIRAYEAPDGQPVGLMVTRPPEGGPPGTAGLGGPEWLASEIRRRLHPRDAVLALQSGWVAVIAATDQHGLEAVAHRLGGQLPQGSGLLFGKALFPQDGEDGQALFEKAVERLKQADPELGVQPGGVPP